LVGHFIYSCRKCYFLGIYFYSKHHYNKSIFFGRHSLPHIHIVLLQTICNLVVFCHSRYLQMCYYLLQLLRDNTQFKNLSKSIKQILYNWIRHNSAWGLWLNWKTNSIRMVLFGSSTLMILILIYLVKWPMKWQSNPYKMVKKIIIV
jgi:hypothetical protein